MTKARERLLKMGDDGELIGKLPEEVSPKDMAQWHTTRNPVKAIRERCLDCCCGDAPEVRKCTAIECPSWPFRMGRNPFRAKAKVSEAERKRRAELLRRANNA